MRRITKKGFLTKAFIAFFTISSLFHTTNYQVKAETVDGDDVEYDEVMRDHEIPLVGEAPYSFISRDEEEAEVLDKKYKILDSDRKYVVGVQLKKSGKANNNYLNIFNSNLGTVSAVAQDTGSTTEYDSEANYNTMIASASTLSGDCYSASILKGQASNNKLEIYNTIPNSLFNVSTVYSSSTLGAANIVGKGKANNNSVLMDGSNISTVYGANIGGGEESEGNNNSVKLTNSHIEVVAATKISVGNASNNSLTIEDSTGYNLKNLNQNAFDAYAAFVVANGEATNNTLTIKNSDYVRYSYGARVESGKATNNSLYAYGLTRALYLYGAGTSDYHPYYDNASMYNNYLEIGNSDFRKAFGGESDFGEVKNNSVYVTKSTVSDSVIGGKTTHGDSTGNSVYITDSELVDANSIIAGGIGGSLSFDNTLIASNTTSFEFAGGVGESLTPISVCNNSAQITLSTGQVAYGGTGRCGNMNGNAIDLANSTMARVYGGYSDGKTSINFISQLKQQMDSLLPYIEEIINEKMAELPEDATEEEKEQVRNMIKNACAIELGIPVEYLDSPELIDSSDFGSSSNENNVTIRDSQVTSVYGGATEIGEALNNKVIVHNSTVDSVYGGYNFNQDMDEMTFESLKKQFAASAAASGNSVSIYEGSTIQNVYGGKNGNGDASNNSVYIEDSTVNNVTGGSTINGDANNNSITLSGATVTGELIGGHSDNGNVEGNSLCLKDKKSTINSMSNISQINFDMGAFVKDSTMLKVSGGTLDLSNMNVNVSNVELGFGEKLTLVEKSTGLTAATDYSKYLVEGVVVNHDKTASVAKAYDDYVMVKNCKYLPEDTKIDFEVQSGYVTAKYFEKDGSVIIGKNQSLDDINDSVEMVVDQNKAIPGIIYGSYSIEGVAEGGVVTINDSETDLTNTRFIGGYSAAHTEEEDKIGHNTLKLATKNINILSSEDFDEYRFELDSTYGDNEIILNSQGKIDLAKVNVDAELNDILLEEGERLILLSNVENADKGIYKLNGVNIDEEDTAFNPNLIVDYVKVNTLGFDKSEEGKVALEGGKSFVTGNFIDKDGNETKTADGNLVFNAQSTASVRLAGVPQAEEIYGFYTLSTNPAKAEVTIMNGLDFSNSTIYGGYNKALDSYVSTGTSLNVKGLNNVVKGIAYFENLNFYLPSETQAGDTLLRVKTAVDLTSTNKVKVDPSLATGLEAEQIVTLLTSDVSLTGVTNEKIDLVGLVTKKAEIKQKDNSLTFNLLAAPTPTPTPSASDTPPITPPVTPDKPQIWTETNQYSKAPAEAVVAANAVAVDLGNMAGNTLVRSIVELDSDDIDTFAHLDRGNLDYDRNCDFNAKTFNLGVGIGKYGLVPNNPNTAWGLAFLYGTSDFTTYNADLEGNGDSKAKGVSILMHSDFDDDYFLDASFYIGEVETSWNSRFGGFSDDATFRGFNVGLGKRYEVASNRTLELYGRFMYTHTNAMSGQIGDEYYRFQDSDSARLRLGFRVEHAAKNAKERPYYGLAWEREFYGDVAATCSAGKIEAPSLNGDTGILEVGCKWQRGNWNYNLKAEGTTGAREGFSGAANAYYKF